MDTPPFSELGLSPAVLAAVEALGFERPSPIQALAIPVALEGKDVVGLSQTGSGKTLAFVAPVLEKIDPEDRVPQALIVCPTRELAVQVCEQAHELAAAFPKLDVVPVYGGAAIERQIGLLRRGAQIIVGTPGRLLDLQRRNALRLDQVRIAVLDEADRMLDMGFRDEMEELLSHLPEDRQMLFFSATMNRPVEALIQRFGHDPQVIKTEQQGLTVESIEQCYYEVRQRSKIEVLSRLLDMDPPRLAIVFCNTKRSVDECTEVLIARGYAADRLHGDITQQMRERVLRRFREGAVELLVATDVAARGLDIDNVDAVFNYDLPQDPEDYVHRIGRTGRAGRSGWAASFVFGRDIYRLQNIERYIRANIPRAHIPTQEQVEGKLADLLFDTVRETLETGDYQDHQAYVDRLLDQGHTPTDIANALFSLLKETHGREGEEIAEDLPQRSRDRRDREKKPERPRREDRAPARDEDRAPARDEDRGRPTRRDRELEEKAAREVDAEYGIEPRALDGEEEEHEIPAESQDTQRDSAGPSRPAKGKAGSVKLFMNLGKKHGILPGEIAGMLYSEARLSKGTIGRIQVFPIHSLIEVPEDLASSIIHSVRDAKLRGKTFRIDVDRGGPPPKRGRY